MKQSAAVLYSIALVLLLVGTTHAAELPDGYLGVLKQFHFNEGTGTSATDTGSHNAVGTLTESTMWKPGKYGDSVNTTTGEVEAQSNLTNDKTYTVMAWVKPNEDITAGSGTKRVVSGQNAGYTGCTAAIPDQCATFGWNIFSNVGSFEFAPRSSSANCIAETTTTLWKADTWQHVAGTVNSTDVCIYVNGTAQNCQASGATDCSSLLTYFLIGSYAGIQNFPGEVDEFHLFDYAMTPQEVADAAGFNADVAFENPTPANNAVVGGNFTINCSSQNAAAQFSMFLDKLPVMELFDSPVEYANFTTNYSTDGVHNYTCNSYDPVGLTFSNNITRNVSIDITRPLMYWDVAAMNHTVLVNPRRPYFNATLIFNDTNLFAYETFIDNIIVDNLSSLTNPYWYNFSLNVLNLSPGFHAINFSAFDGHTARLISDEDVDRNLVRSKTKLSKKGDRDNWVEIEALDNPFLAGNLNVEKKKDRYTFIYHKGNNRQTVQFKVTSSQQIIIMPEGKYRGWLVIPKLKRWVDFETAQSVGKTTVRQVSATEVEVTIRDVNDDTITFESSGYVNVNSLEADFFVANWTERHIDSALGSSRQQFNFSATTNGTHVINASIWYNGAVYNVTRGDGDNFSASIIIPGTAGTYLFNWSVNFTLDGVTQTENLAFSQSVVEGAFDNCTNASWQKILSLCAFDEENGTNITPYDLNINLDFTGDGQFDPSNTHFEFRTRHCYDICVKQNVTYSVNSTMEYSASGYSERKYFLLGFQTNLSTQLIDLYLLNYSRSLEVEMFVYDSQTGEPVEGAYIKILRYYPGQNVDKIVEIEVTDNNGKTVAKQVSSDVYYKYIIEYPAGVVRKVTGIQKVSNNKKIFFINIVGDALATFEYANGVAMQNLCDEDTGLCSFTWSDSSGVVRSARHKVVKKTGVANIVLSDQTSTSGSGSLSYDIALQNNTRYAAYAWINATDNNLYPATTYEFSTSMNPLTQNKDAWKAIMLSVAILLIVLVSVMVDFGAIGVIIGAEIAMMVAMVTTVLPFTAYYAVGFVVIGIILIYKVRKNEA